ncbi:MAG: hypothetical protein HKM04_01890 [Legionellales bacterium]|nr:hypothetical protein [Legionellales bacterium]
MLLRILKLAGYFLSLCCEKLTGDLSDFWSVRINKQWRIIFKWEEGSAYDLDIVDYR